MTKAGKRQRLDEPGDWIGCWISGGLLWVDKAGGLKPTARTSASQLKQAGSGQEYICEANFIDRE